MTAALGSPGPDSAGPIPSGTIDYPAKLLDNARVQTAIIRNREMEFLPRVQEFEVPAYARNHVRQHPRELLAERLRQAAARRAAADPTAADVFGCWCGLLPWDGFDASARAELEGLEEMLARRWPHTMAEYFLLLRTSPSRLDAMAPVVDRLSAPDVDPYRESVTVQVRKAAAEAFKRTGNVDTARALTRIRFAGNRPPQPVDAPQIAARLQLRYDEDRAVWGKASHPEWLANAHFSALLEAWRKVVPWLTVNEAWTDNGVPARRAFGSLMRELRRRSPEALQEHDRYRREGRSFSGALDGAAGKFTSAPGGR